MIAVFIVLSVAVICIAYGAIELKMLKVTSYTVISSKISGDLSGKRIVLLSDLHSTCFGKDNKKLYKMVTDTKPDMVVIAGDLINGDSENYDYSIKLLEYLSGLGIPVFYSFGNHELRLDKLLEYLSGLGIPVFYSFGNHELRLDESFPDRGEAQKYGLLCEKYCRLLNNTHIQYEENCCIYGLALPLPQYDMKVRDGLYKPMSFYLGSPDKDKFNILIAHDPSYIRQYLKWGADLVLSGHLHGGIVRIPFLGGLISPRYTFFPKPDKGIYGYEGERTHIISGGIGWHAIPVRFLNRPEIVAIDLKTG